MPSFSSTSIGRLSTCDRRIELIELDVIKRIDHSIITGHRDKKTQNSLYPKYTKLKWPNGKHNKFPSMAIDVAPYIKPYGALFGSEQQVEDIMNMTGKSKRKVREFIVKAYARLIGYTEAVAHSRNIEIRTGIDWDGDYDMLDQNFDDLGHWELKL